MLKFIDTLNVVTKQFAKSLAVKIILMPCSNKLQFIGLTGFITKMQS